MQWSLWMNVNTETLKQAGRAMREAVINETARPNETVGHVASHKSSAVCHYSSSGSKIRFIPYKRPVN